MSVVFYIPGMLREFTGGNSRVEIAATPPTLGEALSILWASYPGIRDRIATEQGDLREHINIFVGKENIRYTGGLATPVTQGAEVSILPAISGGSFQADSARACCSTGMSGSASFQIVRKSR